MEINPNMFAKSGDKVLFGFLKTALIKSINDISFDPEKSEHYILGVDQLRRLYAAYADDPKFREQLGTIKQRYDAEINNLPRDQAGRPDPGEMHKIEYRRARDIFAELVCLEDDIGGSKRFTDEVGNEGDQFLAPTEEPVEEGEQ